MSILREWLFALSVQQDYGWFWAGAMWLASWLAWRRVGRADDALAWLPAAAWAGMATAVLEISLLVTPVPADPYHPGRWPWDVGLGLVAAAQLGLWSWSAWRTRLLWRRTAGTAITLLAGVIALRRAEQPVAGAVVLASLATGWAVIFLRQNAGRRWEQAALVATILGLWITSYGPLTLWAHSPRAVTDLSPLGVPAAACQALAAGCVGVALLRRSLVTRRADLPEARRVGRQVARAAALWLAGGLVLAGGMGALAARQFNRSAVGRVQAGTALIDRERLAAALGPEFRLGERVYFKHRSGATGAAVRARGLDERALLPVAEALTTLEEANPDIDWARILVVREGVLSGLCESTRLMRYGKIYPGTLAVQGEVRGETWEAWVSRRAHLAGPMLLPHGPYLQARAPLLGRDGAMLAWLAYDLSPSEWAQSQAQARLLAFVIVGLGGVLLLLYWYRQLEAFERAAAQREAAAAAAANQAKTHFLARVSHELRTPVQSILGYGELLAGAPLDHEPRRWLGAVRSQAQLLIRLVNDLIDLSALQTGAFRLAPRPANLALLLQTTVESLRPRAQAKSLDLAAEIAADLPEWLLFDQERLRQVLLNLVGNAIKFTARGRVIVRATWNAPAGEVVIEVIDTGPGIAPEDQARLFRPFSRLERTANAEGAGLGLALSSAICQSMGGRLAVESDGEHGSRFSAELPLPRAEPPVAAAENAAVSITGLRVLVADDNALVRELFVTGLRAAGAWCDSVTDGLEALERCSRERFDVVIVDLSMPWLDGVETTRRLRAADPHRLRIVGVSAHAGAEERAAAESAGMNAFLLKPVSLPALVAVVADLPRERVPPNEAAADLALLRRLRQQFQAEEPSLLAEMQQAMREDDRRHLRARVHYLKNSADVVGYPELSLLCAQVEQLIAHSPPVSSREIRARTTELCAALAKLAVPTE